MSRNILQNNYVTGDTVELVGSTTVITSNKGVFAKTGSKLVTSNFASQSAFNKITNVLSNGGQVAPSVSSEPIGATANFNTGGATSNGTVTVSIGGNSNQCDVIVTDSSGTSVISGVVGVNTALCCLTEWDGTKFRIFYPSVSTANGSLDSCVTSTDGRTWTTQTLTNFPKIKTLYNSIGAFRKNGAMGTTGIRDTRGQHGVFWCGAKFIAIGLENSTNPSAAPSYWVAGGSTDGVTWDSGSMSSVMGKWGNSGSANGNGAPASASIVNFHRDTNSATFTFSDGLVKSTTDGGLTWSHPYGSKAPVVTVGLAPIVPTLNVNGKLFSSASGAMAYSTDGITWTSSSTFFNRVYSDIAYGNSLYVTGGDTNNTGTYLISNDGINWGTKYRFSTNNTSNYQLSKAIAFGNGVFVSSIYTPGGTDANLYWSADGITWTIGTGSTATGTGDASAGSSAGQIVFANGVFIVYGISSTGTNVLRSTDGKAWSSVGTGFAFAPGKIHTNGTIFVALPVSGSSTAYYTSTDGNTWTSRAYSGISSANQTMAWCSGAALWATYYNNTIYTSPDAITWTSRTYTNTATLNNIYGLPTTFCIFSSNYIDATESSNYTYKNSYSTNGIAWTSSYINPVADNYTIASSASNDNICFGNALYLAGTSVNSAIYFTSADAITWTPRRYNITTTGYSVVGFVNGVFISGNQTVVNTILTSADAITWTSVTFPGYALNKSGIYTINNNIYIISTNGTVLYSTNAGSSWSTLSLPTSTGTINTNSSIVYNSNTGTYILKGGYNGTIIDFWISRDGNTFTYYSVSPPPSSMIQAPIAYGNGIYVASGAISIDAVTWVASSTTFFTISFGNGKFLKDNNSYSVDGVNWILQPSVPSNRSSGGIRTYYGNGSFYGMYVGNLETNDGLINTSILVPATEFSTQGHARKLNVSNTQKSVQISDSFSAIVTSTDNLKTFKVKIPDVLTPTVTYVSAAYNGSIILTITNTGRIYKSTNDGTSFSQITLTGLVGTPTVVHADATRYYIFTTTGEVFTSTDATTWVRRGLPVSATYPTSASDLYGQSSNNVLVNSGTANLAWYTSDGGVTWKVTATSIVGGKIIYDANQSQYMFGGVSGNGYIVKLSDITNGYYSFTYPAVTASRTGLSTYVKVD